MSESMFNINLDELSAVAEIFRGDRKQQLPVSWSIPVELREMLMELDGVSLRPKSAHGYDVKFDATFCQDFEKEAIQLGRLLSKKLYPVAGLDENNGVLLLTPEGKAYTIGVDTFDVCFLGSFKQALFTMLTGAPMSPVLPRRDYSQWHNISVYAPGDSRVEWIDSENWWSDTRADAESE